MRLALRLLALGVAFATMLPAASAQTPEEVKVGLTNVSSDVGFFIADKKGYFAAAGIKVTTAPFASAAKMIAPLGTGELDVGGGTAAAGLYNAVARGVNLRIVADKASIAPGYEYSTLLVRKDLVDSGRYRTLKDLKGMTVAVAAQGTGNESSLNEALKKGGLTLGDVNLTFLGFPQHLVAYRNKGIDAGITNEPTMSLAIRDGVAVRASPDVIYPGQQTAVILFSDDFVTQRRDLAEKFMVAYLRAVRYYLASLKDGRIAGPNAGEILAMLAERSKIKDPAVFAQMTAFYVNPDGHVNAKTLGNDLAFFRSLGLINSPAVTVASVVDNSFADAAVKRLGPYQPPH